MVDQVNLCLADAFLAVCQKDWQRSFARFAQFVTLAGKREARCIQADGLGYWADAHLARGQVDDATEARDLLQQALAIYEAIGSTGYIQRTRERLARLG